MTHETNLLICPACKTYMTKAKNTECNRSPEHGDYAICANCAAILVFQNVGERLSYKLADDADIDVAIKHGSYDHLLAVRDFILSRKHGYRNSTKEDHN